MNTNAMIIHALSSTPSSPSAALGSMWALLKSPFATRPARPRTPAEEAAEVRELATRVRASDPGFASDLVAAADRHEQLAGIER